MHTTESGVKYFSHPMPVKKVLHDVKRLIFYIYFILRMTKLYSMYPSR